MTEQPYIHPLAQSERPVQDLYREWLRTLRFGAVPNHKGYLGMNYGTYYGRLTKPAERDEISFGAIVVHKSGRFRFNHHMHGTHRRNVVARHIPFLSWGWKHGRYQWFVDFEVEEYLGRWRGDAQIVDWRNPIHYVSEDLLGARKFGQPRPWLVLEKREGRWAIQPAKNQGDASYYSSGKGTVPIRDILPQIRKDWARYEALILKRYERYEGYALGVRAPSPVSAPSPTMRENNLPLPPDRAVERLAALFEVDRPARIITPLRPKEALL